MATLLRSSPVVRGLPALAALTSGCYFSYDWVKRELGEEAVERTLSFYSIALPCLLEYKALEFRCERLPGLVAGTPLAMLFPAVSHAEEHAKFEPLHAKWAPRFRAKFVELGGFYLKHGQAIANNVADLFPPRWQTEMEPLLDRVPPQPLSKIRAILDTEGFQDVNSLQDPPLGSASIGQVHRAKWRGQSVVVKVQYPEVEGRFRGDVFAVKRICKELFPQYYVAFEEIERQFKTEFDYRGEAENSEDVRRNLALRFPDVVVPRVRGASRRCLVMDEVKGAPLTRALRNLAAVHAQRQGLESVAALVEREERNRAEAASRGELLRNPWWLSSFWTHTDVLALSPGALVDKLLLVHGHQVLVDGCFSGDPHPGNCIVDDDGTVALIDFGQVKRLDADSRLRLANLLLLVDEAVRHDPRSSRRSSHHSDAFCRAKLAVARAMTDMGFATERNDVEVLYALAAVYFGRDDRAWLYPLNFQQWTDAMQRQDPVKSLDACEPLVFVVRCALLLRGIGHCLHEPRNLAVAWKPIATAVLRDAGELEATHATIAYIRHGSRGGNTPRERASV